MRNKSIYILGTMVFWACVVLIGAECAALGAAWGMNLDNLALGAAPAVALAVGLITGLRLGLLHIWKRLAR